MAKKIKTPSLIKSAGNKVKVIAEIFGKVNSNTNELSIAHMTSPEGWVEPGQCPDFNEYTVVLRGTLKVKTKEKEYDISEGQAILVEKGEWVQYSTPYPEGASYIAVCKPAFSPDTVHRDATTSFKD